MEQEWMKDGAGLVIGAGSGDISAEEGWKGSKDGAPATLNPAGLP